MQIEEEDDVTFRVEEDAAEDHEPTLNTEEEPKGEPKVRTFTLVRKSERVDIQIKDGSTIQCLVWEVTGAVRDDWRNFMQSRMRVDPNTGTPVGIKDFRGYEANLIHRCLRTVDDKKVPEKDIRNWPPTIQTELFKMCMELNAMSPKDEEKEKKD